MFSLGLIGSTRVFGAAVVTTLIFPQAGGSLGGGGGAYLLTNPLTGITSALARRSVDSGLTWQDIVLAAPCAYQVVDTYGSTMHMVWGGGGQPNTPRHQMSVDAGLNWTGGESLPTVVDYSSGYSCTMTSEAGVVIAQHIGSNKYARSTNGFTWTQYPLPSGIFPLNGARSLYAAGLFISPNGNNVTSYLTSVDGLTWVARVFPRSVVTPRLYSALGTIVLLDGTGSCLRSTDGLNWTQVTMPATYNWWLAGTNDLGHIACLASNDYTKVAVSADLGLTWAIHTLASAGNNIIGGVDDFLISTATTAGYKVKFI